MAIYMMRESPEYIKYKMNADSNGNLYVPIGGRGHNGYYYGTSYNWKISIDGGTESTYSGTGSQGGTISFSGYTAGSNHTITISPVVEDYGWALSYGWMYNSTGAALVTEIVYDGSYMGFGESATNTGDYFRNSIYYNCTSITYSPDEVLLDTVTSIGNYFRSGEYTSCSALVSAGIEALPSSVTSIGQNFRAQQYYYCSALSEIKGWRDLSIGGSSYRVQQFWNCTTNKSVKVMSNVGYASAGATTLYDSYVSQVKVPSAYLSNFVNATVAPRSSITDSKFVGY